MGHSNTAASEGYSPADFDISSVRLKGTTLAEFRPYAVGDNDKDGIPDLVVKFKRSELVAVLPIGESVSNPCNRKNRDNGV